MITHVISCSDKSDVDWIGWFVRHWMFGFMSFFSSTYVRVRTKFRINKTSKRHSGEIQIVTGTVGS